VGYPHVLDRKVFDGCFPKGWKSKIDKNPRVGAILYQGLAVGSYPLADLDRLFAVNPCQTTACELPSRSRPKFLRKKSQLAKHYNPLNPTTIPPCFAPIPLPLRQFQRSCRFSIAVVFTRRYNYLRVTRMSHTTKHAHCRACQAAL
jgi:hypothetical protein